MQSAKLPKKLAHDRLCRAACLINASQFDAAVTELSAALDLPSDASADPFGWFYGNQRTGWPSEAQLRARIRGDSENPQLHFQLGLWLAMDGRLDEAELRFTQTVSIDRTHYDALVGLGLCRQFVGDFQGAVAFLARAQASCPSDPRISLLLARIGGIAKQSGVIMDLCATVTVD